ncbi:MAG: hypothetical protein ABH827_04295 [bacterium]
MKKHIACLLLLSLCLLGHAGSVFAMQETEKQPKYIPTYVPRGLLVFLDDSEEHFGAVSGSLKAALEQEAGPIITSASLLIRRIKEDNSFYETEKWVIKEIETGEDQNKQTPLYLLLPTTYLEKLRLTTTSPNELKLGLKVEHMPSVSYDKLKQKKITKKIFGEDSLDGMKLSDYADYFFDALGSIFCTRSDYIKSGTHEWPEWSIYLTGHGEMQWRVVSLKLLTFPKVLNFFEHEINTRLVVYQTCYGAGLNTEQIYKENNAIIQKAYPFTIITTALTDAPTSGRPMLVKYSELFEAMTKEGIDYKNVIEALKTPDQNWADVPQIKLPGLTWFSVMSEKNEIASIGEILAKTRDKESLLDVKNYFNDPKIILLYAKNIPLNLAINSDKLEAIISMIPGDAIHTIYKISSTTKTYEQIFDLFMQITMLDPLKIFFIEEINDANQRQIKNVLIYNKKDYRTYNRYAFFEEQDNDGKNSIKIKDLSYKEETLNPLTKKPNVYANIESPNKEQNNLYRRFKSKAEAKVQKLGSFKIESNVLPFNDLSEKCSIEKIEITDKNLGMMTTLKSITEKLPENGICWIKEVFGTSGLLGEAPVTITDVFVKKNDFNIYFYFNVKFHTYHTNKDQLEEIESDYRDEFLKKDDSGVYYMEQPVFKQREGALLHSSITDEGIEKIKTAFTPNSPIKKEMTKKLAQPKEPVKKLKDLKAEDPHAWTKNDNDDKNNLQEQVAKLRAALQQLKKSLVNLANQITQVKLTIGKTNPAPKLIPEEKKPTQSPAIIGNKEDLAKYAKAIKDAADSIKNERHKTIKLRAVLAYVLEHQLYNAANNLGKTSTDIKKDLENTTLDDKTKLTEPEIEKILTDFKEIIQKK